MWIKYVVGYYIISDWVVDVDCGLNGVAVGTRKENLEEKEVVVGVET